MIGATSDHSSSTLGANVQEKRRDLLLFPIVGLLVGFVMWFVVGLAVYGPMVTLLPDRPLSEELPALWQIPSEGARLAQLPGPEFVMAILGVVLTLVVTALVADFSVADHDAAVGFVMFENLLDTVVIVGIFLCALLASGGLLTGSWWLAVAGIGGSLLCSGLDATTSPSALWRRHRLERVRVERAELDALLAKLPAVGLGRRDVSAARRWRNVALYGGAVLAGLVVVVPAICVGPDGPPVLLAMIVMGVYGYLLPALPLAAAMRETGWQRRLSVAFAVLFALLWMALLGLIAFLNPPGTIVQAVLLFAGPLVAFIARLCVQGQLRKARAVFLRRRRAGAIGELRRLQAREAAASQPEPPAPNPRPTASEPATDATRPPIVSVIFGAAAVGLAAGWLLRTPRRTSVRDGP